MRTRFQNKGAAVRPRAAVFALVALGCLGLVAAVGAYGAVRDNSDRLAAVPDGSAERSGAPRGREEFAAWLPRALAGDPEAAYRLGRVYTRGAGRREDFTEAAYWFRKAARAGHIPAQRDLATLYGKGLGVPQDYVRSYAWFAVAAENRGYGMARDQALELRDMMAAFLTPDQRDEAERLAAEWRVSTER